MDISGPAFYSLSYGHIYMLALVRECHVMVQQNQ